MDKRVPVPTVSRHVASFAAFVLRMVIVLAVFFFLVGTVNYCAEAYANDVPTYGRSA